MINAALSGALDSASYQRDAIFNLDVPTQSKAYLHRVGRTARAGARGQAATLMTEGEVRLVRRYESELGIVSRAVRR